MDASKPMNPRVPALPAAITLVAFALRWPAVHRMLPQTPEPDAFLVLHAQQLDGDPALPTGWEFSERYPTLLTRILAAIPRREPVAALTGTALERDDLACAAAPYVHGRVVILLLSVLLVPLTWLVGRRFVGDGAALIAAWLIATSLLHALFSTQARPHGAEATLCLLAVWGSLRIVERPSALRIAVGALFASLAISGLQSGLFTLFPLAMALLLAEGSTRARWLRAFFVPVIALASAFWAYPVLPHVDSTGVHLGGAGSHEFLFSQLNFHGIAVAARLLYGHDPFLFALLLGSSALVVRWIVRNGRDLVTGRRPGIAVVLAYVLPYAALICVSEEIYERFLLPLLPWCAMVSAWTWWNFLTFERPPLWVTELAIFSWLERPPAWLQVMQKWCARGLVVLALVLTLLPISQFARVSARPDALEEAAAWVHANVPLSDPIVGNPYLSPPFHFDPATIESLRSDGSAVSNVWIAWQMAHPRTEPGVKLTPLPAVLGRAAAGDPRLDAWIEGRSPRWVMIEMSRRMLQLPSVVWLRTWADEHGNVVYDSSGTAPDVLEKGLIDYQSIVDFVPRLMRTDVFGQPVRIWQIRR
jgi:hypothetical protein